MLRIEYIIANFLCQFLCVFLLKKAKKSERKVLHFLLLCNTFLFYNLLFATSNAYRLPPEERIYKNTPVVFSTAGDFYLGWFATL